MCDYGPHTCEQPASTSAVTTGLCETTNVILLNYNIETCIQITDYYDLPICSYDPSTSEFRPWNPLVNQRLRPSHVQITTLKSASKSAITTFRFVITTFGLLHYDPETRI